MSVHNVIVVNGVTLYYEIQGLGPSVLCIAGTTGDAGHFTQMAAQWADEFTVVTYDRRGNSRSSRPQEWTQTSVSEQAEDAAALIQALQLAPMAVFGTDAGGRIALDLLTRFPHLLRGVVLHDPVLSPALRHPDQLTASVQAAIHQGFQYQGLPGGVEAVLRYVAGDTALAAIPPQTLARMLQNAETIFAIERSPDFAHWCPAEEALSRVQVPVTLCIGQDSLAFFAEMAQWLALRLHIPVLTVPGGHAAYFDHASALAEALRPVLRQFHMPV